MKTEYDQEQGSAMVGQMRNPLCFALRSFADGSETLSGFFVGLSGERFRKKPEGLKRAAGQTVSIRSAGARGQGERGSLWRS